MNIIADLGMASEALDPGNIGLTIGAGDNNSTSSATDVQMDYSLSPSMTISYLVDTENYLS